MIAGSRPGHRAWCLAPCVGLALLGLALLGAVGVARAQSSPIDLVAFRATATVPAAGAFAPPQTDARMVITPVMLAPAWPGPGRPPAIGVRYGVRFARTNPFGGDPLIVDVLVLGEAEVAYDAFVVDGQGPARPTAFEVSLRDPALRAWAQRNIAGAGQWETFIEIDPDRLIEEGGGAAKGNNTVAGNISRRFRPLSSALRFGGAEARFAEDVVTVLPNDAACAGAAARFPTGNGLRWAPSRGGHFPPIELDAEVCVDFALAPGGAATDLVARSDTEIRVTLNGHLGGVPSALGVRLTEDGVVALKGTLEVPGVAWFEDLEGRPAAVGRPGLSAGGGLVGVGDVDDLVLTAGANPRWIRAGQLPFLLRLSALTATVDQVTATYDAVWYLQAQRYHPDDARGASGLQSNDGVYAAPRPAAEQTETTLLIGPAGLTGQVDFGGRGGQSHRPVLGMVTPRHSATFADNALAPSVFDGPVTLIMEQHTGCPGCERATTRPQVFVATLPTATLSPDGALMGQATFGDSGPTGPAFGPLATDGVQTRRRFARPQDAARGAIALLPGRLAVGTAREDGADVAGYLRASRAADLQHVGVPVAEAVGAPGGRDYAVGNGFFPGLTVGPEVLANAAGQPEPRAGVSIDDLPTRVGLGGTDAATFFEIGGSPGTKYVLRPAGVTGTFHTFDAPEVLAYGYPLALARFAFRTVHNALDPVTWIDGQVRVGGRADFGLGIEGLGLTCTGQLAHGRLRARDCAANPAVNCDQRLRAWRADYDVASMQFEPAPGEDACSTEPRRLRTVGRLEVQSLTAGLDLNAAWTPEGDAVDAEVLGPARNRVDAGGGDPGFTVMLDGGVTLGPVGAIDPVGGLDTGFFSFRGLVPVPFFEALDSALRLENRAPGANAPRASLIAPADALPEGWSTDPLDTVAARLADDRNLRARYRWGSTGYGIELPLRYDGGRAAAGQGPRFIGLTQQGFDLRVIRAQAAVNVLTPDYTEVSFGASADFNVRLMDDIDLHLDLNDPESVRRADRFLARFLTPLLGPGPYIEPVIDAIRSRVSLTRRITGAGFDDHLEAGVRAAAEAVIRPIYAEVAQTLGVVQSLPARLGALIVDRVRAEVQALLAPFDRNVGLAISRIYLETPQLIVDAQVAVAAGLQVPDAVRFRLEADVADLERILAGFLHVSGHAQTLRQHLADLRADVTALVTQFDAAVQAAEQALDRALALLSPGPLSLPVFQCDSLGAPAPGNVLLTQLDDARNQIQQTLNTLAQNPLARLGLALAAAVGLDQSALQRAEADIRREAQALAAELDAAVAAMNGVLAQRCGEFAQSTAEIRALLDDARRDLLALRARLVSLQTQLLAELARLESPIDLVRRFALEFHAALRAVVDDLKLVIEGEIPPALLGGINATRFYLNTRFHFVSPFMVWYIELPGGTFNFAELFERLVLEPFDAGIGALVVLTEQAIVDLRTGLDFPSADALVAMTVALVMDAPIVAALDRLLHDNVITILDPLDRLVDRFFDQVNTLLQRLLAQLEQRIEAALSAANSALEGIPIDSARMDGFAAIRGGSLERLHVNAEWRTRARGDQDGVRFAGALDVVAWSANGKGAGCNVAPADAASRLDATLSGYDVPLTIGGSDVMLSQVFLGFTLDDLLPIGLFGGFDTVGALDFQGFSLHDLGLRFGAGVEETYLGARGAATFSAIQMEAAFLVGRTCSDAVLLDLDPQVGEFLALQGQFAGAYVRGGASIPIWDNGCALTVGANADAGMWALAEANGLRVGGLVGGGLWGEALCIAALRGSLTALAEYQAGRLRFRGEGFAVAGLGFDCDPHTWTTVARSRRDSWCGTGDAQFGATYSGGWSVDALRTSAIH